MALIFRNIGLAIYEQTEWDKMMIAEQNQALADYNLFVAPDGIRQALDTDTYTLTDMGNAELFLAISGCRVHYDDAKNWDTSTDWIPVTAALIGFRIPRMSGSWVNLIKLLILSVICSRHWTNVGQPLTRLQKLRLYARR